MQRPEQGAVLERATFRTSRLLDFASKKELIAQTGHQVEEWPYVILKELIDNSLDACEEADIAPEISLVIDQGGIEVSDNGPGLPADVVKDILDFSVRVSSRDAYVSPTRGAQGNALKTLVAMPYVLGGENLGVEIEARGTLHTIVMSIDKVRQEPTIRHEEAPSVQTGTRIRVNIPVSACSNGEADKANFLHFAGSYLWLNPHLSITLNVFGERMRSERTFETWRKWKPSDPTSPHWYTQDHIERLIAAYIKHDAGQSRQRTVADLVAEFRGFAGSGKRKAILQSTGLARVPLSELVNGAELDHAVIGRLLGAMQKDSTPVRPEALGIVGRDHFAARMTMAGCRKESFVYKMLKGTTGGVPWAVEVAFAWRPEVTRIMVSGVNWSRSITNPFRNLNSTSLDTLLSEQRCGRGEPVAIAIHLACARVEYTDRGKSAAVVPPAAADAITSAIRSVTAKWAKQRKREEREFRAHRNREHIMARSRHISITEAANHVMEEAYMKASANGTLPAHARQIMYAARGAIQDITGKPLNDVYFTQQLLPDYIQENGVDWNVVYDARGAFTEPHTRARVPLGTLQVRAHLASIDGHEIQDPEYAVIDKHYPTLGPKNRYGAVLFIEKEGFMPLFEAVHLAERYDLAIMSTKGMSVTASRELVDRLCGEHGIPLLVLHDFDVSGFSIFGTLSADTRRYQFSNDFDVTDLGLRLADIDGLESEEAPLVKSPGKVQATLLRHGATLEEAKFLERRRVELNALPSDQLVAFIERKLAEHGVAKVTPDTDTLADAYRRMRRQAQVQRRIDDLLEEMAGEPEDAITIPADLRRKIKAAQKKDPSVPWDAALRKIVAGGLGA